MTEADFENYYLNHYGALLLHALRLTSDFFLAEELVNDTFVKARELDEKPPHAWLNTVLRRAVIDAHRRRLVRAPHFDALSIETTIIHHDDQPPEPLAETLIADEDVEATALNILEIKELLERYPKVTAALFDRHLPERTRTSRLAWVRRTYSPSARHDKAI